MLGTVFSLAGTPREIIDKINTQVAKVIETKDVQATLALLGNEPIVGVGPDQFEKFLKTDLDKWRKVGELAGK